MTFIGSVLLVIGFLFAIGHQRRAVTRNTVLASCVLVVGVAFLVASPERVAAVRTPIAVYDSIGASVPGNVASLGFEATSSSEFGDLVTLGAGPRLLQEVTVLMSSWGCDTGTTPCVTTPGATFSHPLTLNIYAVAGTADAPVVGALLDTQTVSFEIPFRPSHDEVACPGTNQWSNGVACFNGFATPVTFDYAGTTSLPDTIIWTMSYSTTTHGPSPIGPQPCSAPGSPGDCGYDSLNVGARSLPGQPSVGVDVDTDGVFWKTSHGPFYCDGGTAGAGALREDTGPGCWSANRPLATISTVGLADTATAVAGTPGDSSAAVIWAAPASDGGASITDYTVTSSPGGETCSTAGTLSCTVNGLTNGTPYTFAVVTTNEVGPGPASAPSAAVTPTAPAPVITVPPAPIEPPDPAPGEPTLPDYTPVGPKRVFDTRAGLSPNALLVVRKQQVGGATSILEVQMTDLPGGYVPSVTDVGAVSLNVTVTNPVAAGFLSVYSCDTRDEVSTVNFAAGETVANAAIATVSGTGAVCFFSTVPTDIVVDLNGWFAGNQGFNGVGPRRVFDTRAGLSPTALRNVAKQLVGAAALEVKVTDLPGYVPAAGAGAVSLNVTATNATDAGFVTVDSCGTREFVSNVNYTQGQSVANAVVATVSASGSVCFYSSTPVDIVVDINGWLPSGRSYAGVGPARVFDTRLANSPNSLRSAPKAKVGGDNVLEVKVTDLPGLVPVSGAGAVSLNVTATNGVGDGFVAVYSCGTREAVSSVNFTHDGTVANAVIAPVSAAGTVCFFATNDTDLVVDINGWFAAPAS